MLRTATNDKTLVLADQEIIVLGIGRLDNRIVRLGARIGKGGEGEVYRVAMTRYWHSAYPATGCGRASEPKDQER